MEYRLVEAAREVLYNALTAPPLAYIAVDGTTAEVPVANVIPRNIWEIAGPAAVPLVAIGIAADHGRVPISITRLLGERAFSGRVTVVSGISQAEAVSIGDAIVTLLDFADQGGNRFSRDTSRVASAHSQPITVRFLQINRVSDPAVEEATSRYTVTIEFGMIAA